MPMSSSLAIAPSRYLDDPQLTPSTLGDNQGPRRSGVREVDVVQEWLRSLHRRNQAWSTRQNYRRTADAFRLWCDRHPHPLRHWFATETYRLTNDIRMT